jgi:hypothetical protein
LALHLIVPTKADRLLAVVLRLLALVVRHANLLAVLPSQKGRRLLRMPFGDSGCRNEQA